jgi:branched-chain amino acid transport system substrate-binding protein
VFIGTSVEATAGNLFDAIAASSPKAKLFGSSALSDDAFVASLIPTAQANTFLTSPGFPNGRALTPAGAKFVADFKAATGRDPGPGGGAAIFGYEAMALTLDVLRRAGSSAANHGTVIAEFHNTKDRASVLGTYSINQDGDTTLNPAPYVLQHIRAGKLAPFKPYLG